MSVTRCPGRGIPQGRNQTVSHLMSWERGGIRLRHCVSHLMSRERHFPRGNQSEALCQSTAMLPHSKPRFSAPYWRKDVTVSGFGAWCLHDARFAWSRFALCRIFTLTNVRANLVLPNSCWLVLPRHFRCQLFRLV